MYTLLAIFILTVIHTIIKGSQGSTCDVVPKDVYVEVGSSAEIICQTSCVHGEIFWKLDGTVIDHSLSRTINSSHVVLMLRNITNEFATLQCYSTAIQQVLGGTTIRTYHKIKKPHKLSCILHNENQAVERLPELFTCTWEHQVSSSLKINYTVLCTSCSPQSEVCKSHETTCTTSYFDIASQISFVGNHSVIVRAKSAASGASSDHFEFSPFNIWKIPHSELNVTSISDGVLVEWKIPLDQLNTVCHCQVKYKKAVSNGSSEVLSKTMSHVKAEMTIEEVDSCSNYTFAVRCSLEKGPWSDWSQKKTVLTKLNRRDFAPHLWRKIAEADENGIRKVRAMWTAIPTTCQDTLTYAVTKTRYSEQRNDASCVNSTCDVNGDAHRINLRVSREGTLFAEDSVHVPATEESLPHVTNIQALTHEGTILVSWNAPEQPISGYMIDYTHDGNQYLWKETEYTNATLFDLPDNTSYDITITPLYEDKTGHSSQARHICSRVGDPGSVVIVNVQVRDKSAQLSWILKPQEVCSGDVVSYTVFYRTDKETKLNDTVDGTQQEISLKNLKPETQYSVYVQATALTGTSKSSERFFTTKRFDPRLSMVLIFSGSFFIIFVLLLGLCCANHWKKFKEKPLPNPGNSSVALWSLVHEKGGSPFMPFTSLSESVCDRVYTEEAQRTSTSPLDTDWSDYPVSDPTEQDADPATVPEADEQNEHPSSPGETTELLFSETCLSYLSQNPVETLSQRSSRQCKCVPVKQQEKLPGLTVYVTLDMFEQGQGR